MSGHLRIGTRGSTLAQAQAGSVATALAVLDGPVEVVPIVTDGDARVADSTPGEGAFVGSIETALRAGTIDIAVHSAKDLPTDRDADPELVVAAYLRRADPRDALVTRAGRATLAALPAGASVGTDSLRRAGFVLAQRPDLHIRSLAGNVDTRLHRLDAGEVSALVLAVAGLARLGLGGRVDEALDPAVVPPAAGQGALAVQVRRADHAIAATVGRLDDLDTRTAVETERAILAAVGGGCQAPVGALASLDGERLSIVAARVESDGSRPRILERSGSRTDSLRLARAMAAELVQ
jgi:hydroxymethylbilane synthase